MAQQCRTCIAPDLDAINLALASGETASAVALRYGLGKDSVTRHRKAHLTPAMVRVAAGRRNEKSAIDAHERLRALLDEMQEFLEMARAKQSAHQGSLMFAQILRALEMLFKINGQLDDRPTVTVNVLSSPEVTQLIAVLLGALHPYPDARQAAAAALEAIDVEVVA